MQLSKTFFLFLLFIPSFLIGQTLVDNPIEQAKSLIKEKKYAQAETLLASYYPTHSNDLNTNWLYAQVLHWNYKNKLSEELFLKAIALSPKNNSIQLDYARMLYESSEFKKAQSIIEPLKNIEETQAEALLMEANIHFWNGNIDEAQNSIQQLKKLYPNNDITNEIVKNIANATSSYLKTNFEYQSDNQPMTLTGEKIQIGQYRSWLLSPKLEVSNYNFNPTQQALIGQISNQLYVANVGFSATVQAGAYKNFSGNTDWIGGIELNQKLINHTVLKIGYNKKPYLGTLSSTAFNLTQNNVFGDLDYNNEKYISIHAGYNHQFFKDNNSIETISSWIISKPFLYADFKLQFGYGFNYSNAKTNLFTPKESISEAMANYSPTMTLNGYYNPYFTPNQQMVNSLLLIMNYKASHKIELGAKATYGFMAQCQNPYLYLDTDNNGNTIFSKDYSKTNFNPYEITAFINCKVTASVEAKLTYTNQQTFFYNRNNINLGLNFRI